MSVVEQLQGSEVDVSEMALGDVGSASRHCHHTQPLGTRVGALSTRQDLEGKVY